VVGNLNRTHPITRPRRAGLQHSRAGMSHFITSRLNSLSLPISFQFCAGSAAEIRRLRNPEVFTQVFFFRGSAAKTLARNVVDTHRRNHRKAHHYCLCALVGAWDRSAILNYFVEFIHIPRLCQGAKNWSPGPGGAAPAKIHRPSRAKSSDRESGKFWVMTRSKFRRRYMAGRRDLLTPMNF